MTNEEAVRKLEYSKTAYQMLIDEKVDSGKLVGKDVKGEWKADTPLDEAYKSMIEALEMGIKAIKALEQEPILDKIRAEIEAEIKGCETAIDMYKENPDIVLCYKTFIQSYTKTMQIIDKYRDKEQEDNGFFDEIMDESEEDEETYEKIKEIIDKVKEQET